MKGQNESCATDNTKFSKFGTKGKDIGMDFNSWDDKFESVMQDKEYENHGHIDVKTNTKEITDIVVAEKHIIGMEKDDDVIFNPIIDIAKLFDTPTVSGNFSVYVFPKQLASTIFKRICELKKSYFLQPPFIDKEKEN